MKPGMTSILFVSCSVDSSVCIRLAANLETGEYATYTNYKSDKSEDDSYGHYFQCEGAKYLAHKLATEDFFKRVETGI